MDRAIRWGILGTGNIAHLFARGLSAARGAELVAVGSRAAGTAEAFGAEFNIPHRHSTYTALATDPNVDVVYVATPHSLHKENTLMCLREGKAVLCEKPFAINALEVREMIDVAREKQLFLTEAMWTRYVPSMVKVRELLAAGTIGDVRMIYADFGFRCDWNPESRVFDLALGGGALLDVGVYTVSLASMIFGPPARVMSMADLGKTGVDEQAAILLGYGEGQLAVLSTAVRTTTPQEATLMGTEGSIKIHAPWWRPSTLTLERPDRDREVIAPPYEGNGYNYEAEYVMKCLRDGTCESDVMPLGESQQITETMDQIRAQWGLKYPME